MSGNILITGNIKNIIKYDYQIMKSIARNQNKINRVPNKKIKYKSLDNKISRQDFINIFKCKNY